MLTDTELDNAIEWLIDNTIITEQTLLTVFNINGYTLDTLNDVIYSVTGCADIEQLKDEVAS